MITLSISLKSIDANVRLLFFVDDALCLAMARVEMETARHRFMFKASARAHAPGTRTNREATKTEHDYCLLYATESILNKRQRSIVSAKRTNTLQMKESDG